MIGWYVNIGYSDDGSNVTNINDITFTDYKVQYNLFTVTDYFSLSFPRTESGARDLGNEINSMMREEYFSLFGAPYVTVEEPSLNILNIVLSTVARLYTNSIGYVSGKTRNVSIFVHFISIGKIVQFKTSPSSGTVIYSINGDNLDVIFYGSGSVNRYLAYANTISADICGILNYDSSKPIGDQSLYHLVVSTGSNEYNARISSFSVSFKNFFDSLFSSSIPDFDVPPGENPYEPIPPSEPGGGGGVFDDSSDLIPDSPLPTLSSANTGFTRIYNPTLSQVQDLARYLWTDESLVQTLWNKVKQYFEDPMQAIIGFNLVPVPVPDAGTKSFALMYIDTGVDMNVAASQFVDRDCGTLKIEPFYGSALDYAPHTKISIFLPFIGTIQLNTDEVMGRTLQVKYRVDICSGSCVAKVAVDGNFIYQFSGHCATPIPISSSDFSSYVGAAISVAKLGITAAVGAATGGAGLFATGAAQKTGREIMRTTTTDTIRNPQTGRQVTASTHTVEKSTESTSSTGASFDGISPQNVSNTVGEIMASKPYVEHSGSFSGNTGYLGVRRPFLIIERPNICLPENYQSLNGYPSMITMNLSECTGYTVVQQVQLNGFGATNPEQAEILELLKGGVIF